jgi:hypothetical protein
MNRCFQTVIGIASICALYFSATASSATLFQEDFESGLSQWTSNQSGIVVIDPLQSANHVLTFTSLGSAGDIFATPVSTLEPAEGIIVVDSLDTIQAIFGWRAQHLVVVILICCRILELGNTL